MPTWKVRYRVLYSDAIACGGCAQVVEAVHKSTGLLRAAKILDIQQSPRSRSNLISFYNETQILRKLQETPNTHVIYLHESYILKQSAIMVLDRMDTDLLDLILDDSLRLSQKMAIFRDLCLALNYCHENNVAHLDVKPDNVLLQFLGDGQFSVRLADFGSSQEMARGNVQDTSGTLFYNAPEVVRQESLVDGVQADIWSLGVTLHVLLSGTWPFLSSDPTVIRSMLSQGQLAIDDTLPPNQQEFLSFILQCNPADRPSISDILEFEFMQQFFPSPSLHRKKHSLPGRFRRWVISPRCR